MNAIISDLNLPITQQKLKVCFIGLYTYPLFNSSCISPFGGSEVRISLFAKELALRGNVDVSLITFDHGQPLAEQREGVRIISWAGKRPQYPVYPEEDNFKSTSVASPHYNFNKLKSYVPKFVRELIHVARQIKRQYTSFGVIGNHIILKSDVSFYDEVDADIFVIPGNTDLSAELAYYCKKKNKKLIILAGSDLDFNPEIKSNPQYITPYGVSGLLMQYTLDNADTFISQTERQRRLLREHFQRDGIVIRNPLDLSQKSQPVENSKLILWVGKSDKVKRPELVLDLAKEFPEYDFTLLMSFSNKNIHNETLSSAKSMSNVTIQTYIPYNQVEEIYAKASLLVNTSVFEGFPNAFLQAAKYGIPILSLNVDPGEMLTTHGCGRFCKGDFEAMKSALTELMAKDSRDRIGANSLEYVRKYHDKTVIAKQFEDVLLTLFTV